MYNPCNFFFAFGENELNISFFSTNFKSNFKHSSVVDILVLFSLLLSFELMYLKFYFLRCIAVLVFRIICWILRIVVLFGSIPISYFEYKSEHLSIFLVFVL